MKKSALIFCILMVLTVFAGCGSSSKAQGDASTASNTASGAVSDSIFSTEPVSFKTVEGDAKYRIVRAEDASEAATAAALSVFKQYRDAHGVASKNMTDVEEGTDVYEILVGDTNRSESKQARDWLVDNTGGRYDDYIICTIGKKIVIQAISDNALTEASKYFVDNYLKHASIEGGIKYTYAMQGNFSNITINGVNIGRFSIVRPHYNSSYLTYAAIEEMSENVLQTTGFMLNINDDSVTDEAEYEIIIGDCRRPGVTVPDNRDQYYVTVSGKKVYIIGGGHPATTIAVSEFYKKLSAGALTDADSFSGSYTQTVANYDTSTYYTPVFYDDFDGDTLDTTKWNLRGGTGNSGWSAAGENGARADRSTDPNYVFVSDGMFQIHPYYDTVNNVYYGGFLESNGKMLFTYGYIEMSAKIPDGDGFWSSLWLRCRDFEGSSRPEIDINECFGNAAAVASNLHTWPGTDAELYGVEHTSLDGGKYPDKKYFCPDGKKFSEDFHTYGLLWTDKIAWFTCDGVPYFKYTMGDKATDSWCFGKKVWVVISEAVGFESNSLSINNATPQEWENSSQLYVDWFYLYQINDGKQVIEFNVTQSGHK